jgi:hypothetical protein
MAGTNKSPRQWLADWVKEGVTANQTTGADMAIVGYPLSIKILPLARKTSLVTVGIILSAAVTAGLIRFEIVKNGTPTGQTFDMTSTEGTKQMWTFNPGTLTGVKGDEIGIQWGSNAALLPTGTIDSVLSLEVQDD